MGLVFGILLALLTIPVAWVVLMEGSNWETGEGGHPVSGGVTLLVGWGIAGFVIYSHFHRISIPW